MDFQKVNQYSKNLTVLYAEDDELLLKKTSDLLEDFFLSVEATKNGKIVLEKYQNYYNTTGKFYDIVITDINMPVMDGRELIKDILEINPEQVIIVISAYNDSNLIIELIQEGINNFILKPIVPKQIMSVLHKACRNITANNNALKYYQKLYEYNNQLDKKLRIQAEEIYATQKISIETFAKLVESYDDSTGFHVKRIERYTKLFIKFLSIDSPYKKFIEENRDWQHNVPMASILHDIGKMVIPKEILTKPSKLTAAEFEIIKTHPKVGGNLLKEANQTFYDRFGKDSYLKPASDIAMYHHEKFSGGGYPDGLKGEEIPLAARIVAIADVYDALREKRVYKDSWTHKKAKQIIQESSGNHFDPILVDIFSDFSHTFDDTFNNLQK